LLLVQITIPTYVGIAYNIREKEEEEHIILKPAFFLLFLFLFDKGQLSKI